MKEDNRPIGIFDSGIGGLTVAKAISDVLPNESIIYFGDTAHLPYGDKSSDLIKRFSFDITDFLIHKKQCKSVVIACNTASAVAYEALRDNYQGETPIINVIDPIIEAVANDSLIKKIGLIATQTTINSRVYQEKLKRRSPSVAIESMATPLLVPMIEEGFADDNISHVIIENYLSDPRFEDIDALILGCTHYVLIRSEIDSFFDGKVKLFDSTKILADKLKVILKKEGLVVSKSGKSKIFYVSDYTSSFEQSASRFYEQSIELQKIEL